MDLSHIAHWIQRTGEELLGYHPFDEGSDQYAGEEDYQGSGWTPPPVDDSMPRATPTPDVRRCRALVNGQEVGGVIDVATGVVTLDESPEGSFFMHVVWIAEPSSEVRIIEHTGELAPSLGGEALRWLEMEGARIKIIVNGVEDAGARIDEHGRLTLSVAPPAGEFSLCMCDGAVNYWTRAWDYRRSEIP